MRTLASSVLVAEAFVVFFATLVAKDLSDLDGRTVWLVGGSLSLACLIVTALLRRPAGYVLGWVVQGLVLAAGVVVPAMFVLGAIFVVLWGLALHLARKAERLQAGSAAIPSDQ
jgi:ABC-type uncharacterized transport system permease subunit